MNNMTIEETMNSLLNALGKYQLKYLTQMYVEFQNSKDKKEFIRVSKVIIPEEIQCFLTLCKFTKKEEIEKFKGTSNKNLILDIKTLWESCDGKPNGSADCIIFVDEYFAKHVGPKFIEYEKTHKSGSNIVKSHNSLRRTHTAPKSTHMGGAASTNETAAETTSTQGLIGMCVTVAEALKELLQSPEHLEQHYAELQNAFRASLSADGIDPGLSNCLRQTEEYLKQVRDYPVNRKRVLDHGYDYEKEAKELRVLEDLNTENREELKKMREEINDIKVRLHVQLEREQDRVKERSFLGALLVVAREVIKPQNIAMALASFVVLSQQTQTLSGGKKYNKGKSIKSNKRKSIKSRKSVKN